MSGVHPPQQTPPSHLPASSHWAPGGSCTFSGPEVWEIAQRTSPDSASPAKSCGSGKCKPLTPVFSSLRSRMRARWPLSERSLFELGPHCRH